MCPAGPDPRSIAIGEEEGLVGVEQWAEIRRMHRVEGLSIREISRRTGLHRKTVAGRWRRGAAEVLAGGGGVEAGSVQGLDL